MGSVEFQSVGHRRSSDAPAIVLGFVLRLMSCAFELLTVSINPAIGIWTLWTDTQAGVQDVQTQISLDVIFRVRVFFVLTFCLNFLYSGML